ncbi:MULTISPECIES: hypothetical protein [unclassified Streptomyces]|uniref:hypothetical protein n=1 Tax=unclassified Streptomyces TaxID=2593676 RepID=UPI0033A71FAF
MTMVYLVIAASAVAAVLTAALTVLVRRERRRSVSGPDGHRIETAATQALRDARRQAHARQHFNDGGGISALRDRDSSS